MDIPKFGWFWSDPRKSNDFWSGVGWPAYQIFHVWYVFGACLEVVWRFE